MSKIEIKAKVEILKKSEVKEKGQKGNCCTCTDSLIMGTGSNKVDRQLASF